VEYRKLGASRLQVSVLGIGCWPFAGGDYWGEQPESDSIAAVHAALDYGINLFDTAEVYGNGRSEEVLGKALVGRRERALIATKISPSNAEPATLRAHCEASLRRLQTDYIDVYQVHWPIEPALVGDAFRTLQDLQTEGKVREIGVSNHGVQQLTQALATGARIVSNQMAYSLITRALEERILPLCRQHNISIIPYMALMQALLAGKYDSVEAVPDSRRRTRHFSSEREGTRHGGPGYEALTFATVGRIRDIAEELDLPMARVALAWVMARPGVACVLAGARRPDQVERNVLALDTTLSSEALAALDAATEKLRVEMGPNADYWQGGEESRIR
jgi:aryl-alcohol dehydrogenase-like predicted oxidoreductase